MQISALCGMDGREIQRRRGSSREMFLYVEPWIRGGSGTVSIPHRETSDILLAVFLSSKTHRGLSGEECGPFYIHSIICAPLLILSGTLEWRFRFRMSSESTACVSGAV